jgi:putative endonuclease
MGNNRPTLYTGVSRHIIRRILEHKNGKIKGFTQKHNLKVCLYYEFCETMRQAIIREKQIKNMNRKEKLELIKSKNPLMSDISSELFSLVDNPNDIVTFSQV